eukprot:gene8797-biopygen9770
MMLPVPDIHHPRRRVLLAHRGAAGPDRGEGGPYGAVDRVTSQMPVLAPHRALLARGREVGLEDGALKDVVNL